jgi:hypothetical protein
LSRPTKALGLKVRARSSECTAFASHWNIIIIPKGSGSRFALPDSDSLQADLVSVGYKYTSDGKLLLESKQDMRKRGVPSPDEADAVALCFADASGFPRGRNFTHDLTEKYQGLYV